MYEADLCPQGAGHMCVQDWGWVPGVLLKHCRQREADLSRAEKSQGLPGGKLPPQGWVPNWKPSDLGAPRLCMGIAINGAFRHCLSVLYLDMTGRQGAGYEGQVWGSSALVAPG